jgi:8-oxo-dGTP diphosphatase
MVPVTAAIIQDERGRVLLAQRPAQDRHPLKWEFPGGKLQDRESPEACLRRELEEELGIQVEVGEVFHVVNHAYRDRSILLLAYICRWKGGKIHLREHKAHEWVEPERLLEFDLTEADLPVARKLSDRSSNSSASLKGAPRR